NAPRPPLCKSIGPAARRISSPTFKLIKLSPFKRAKELLSQENSRVQPLRLCVLPKPITIAEVEFSSHFLQSAEPAKAIADSAYSESQQQEANVEQNVTSTQHAAGVQV